jgi:anti-sigma factor RsiW
MLDDPMENSVPVCRDMTELSTDYLEGALPIGKSLAVRWHLSICSFCRRHYRQVREAVALLRRMPPEPVPAQIEDQVIVLMSQEPRGIRPIEPDASP